MAKWLVSGFMVLALVLISAAVSVGGEVRMSKEDLREILGKPGVFVIDVRLDYGKSPAKIQGAIREDPMDSKSWAKKYDRNSTIVLYCS